MLNNGPETDTAIYDGTNNGVGLTVHTAQVGTEFLHCSPPCVTSHLTAHSQGEILPTCNVL